MKKRPKVFGIGFHKTATSSLGKALEILGYRVKGEFGARDPRIAEIAKPHARRFVEEFDAFQDNPWPILFRELDEWFPDGKFVLTVRDVKSWFTSVETFFGDRASPMRTWIYGVGVPRGNETIYRARYERHTQEVLTHFAGRRGKLLVMDITRGEGWELLCPFLEVSIPSVPFPDVKPTLPPLR